MLKRFSKILKLPRAFIEFFKNRIFTRKFLKKSVKLTYRSLKLGLYIMICFTMVQQHQRILELERSQGEFIFPYESFGQVVIDIEIEASNANQAFEFSSTGSSIVIDTSDGISTVLTAEHVCNPPPMKKWKALVDPAFINHDITVVDYYGNEREAEIVLANPGYDLCLLRVVGVWAPAVPLADSTVSIGEKVYNVASPAGFFSPGMVPLLEGRYSGDMSWYGESDSVYTIPVRGGSSGSGVLNSRGELVGIIHSAIYNFPNVGLACTYEELDDFLTTYKTLFPN